MWSVNAFSGCADPRAQVELRRSTDGINWTAAPENIELGLPGLAPWHIEVQWVAARNEYWALYNAKAPGSCTTQELFLATSTDGVAWHTHPTPVLTSGTTHALADIVYRSTFAYDPDSDVITFWYSGARFDGRNYVWSTVAQRRRRADVFNQINAPMRASPAQGSGARVLPPLTDPP
jgi:hypothetical protein